MTKKAFLLALLMFLTSATAVWLTPKVRATQPGMQIKLEEALPTHFGDWRLVNEQGTLVVNPQQAEMLETIYSQTVAKTYVRSDGYRIMLSIAYGDDQSRATQLHKPETCYASQGFGLKFTRPAILQTRFGDLETTQMFAYQGARMEPITYWMRVGNVVIRGGLPQAILRVKLGLLKREVPDGLLVRVSDISSEPESSFKNQNEFILSLLDAASPELRAKLIGAKAMAI